VKIYQILLATGSMLWAIFVLADIRFDESSQFAGIKHAGQTYGASWGDFNGDGWPDLWVGNHNSKPSLYLNKQDGTFVDIIDNVWTGNSSDDAHGAAWADFDNDGDQDLVELVGARENADGSLCFGCGKNHFFVNQDGVLIDKASELGLDKLGLARSPLWLDVNRDGKLDLLVVNTRGRKQPSSAIFLHESNRFVEANNAVAFVDAPWSLSEQVSGFFHNAMRFNFKSTNRVNAHPHLEFAQLASLSNDSLPNVLLSSSPSRIYSLSDKKFEDVTNTVNIPDIDSVKDVAVADFDGDGKLDIYLVKSAIRQSDVVQLDKKHIKGTLSRPDQGSSNTLYFRSAGNLDIQLYPTWLSLAKVFIGSAGRNPETRSFVLSPEDLSVSGPEFDQTIKKKGVSITYDPNTHVWMLRRYVHFIDFIIQSDKSIEKVKTPDFSPFKAKEIDTLLVRSGAEFIAKNLQGEAGAHSACHSVTAGDFDNDMDVDLYLVCTGPVKNLSNRLLENDGKGNFRLIPNAGGASGSHLGRGDVVVMADYNRDGFLDLFLSNGFDPDSPFVKDGPHQLFVNQGNNNHWLEIDLEGVQSNRDGIGASVILEVSGVKQFREQNGGMHRISQNYQRLHFGLGGHDKVDRLTIKWPSGIVQEVRDIGSNQIIKIREKTGLTFVNNAVK